MSSRAKALLDTGNLLHNLDIIRGLAPTSGIIAMVKANAYGHGIRSIASRLQHRVAAMGVSSLNEGITLREVGISCPIILMEGVLTPDELSAAIQNRLDLVFHDQHQLSLLESAHTTYTVSAWIKIDTGMSRLGFAPENLQQVHQKLSSTPFIKQPIGLMSHFACSDDRHNQYNHKQIELFESLARDFPGPKSLCNSGGIWLFPKQHYDYVRPGLALYGISPLIDKSATDLLLKPVMTLATSLLTVRYCDAGAGIGYGLRFVCPETMPVGVIAIGYGDGYPRSTTDGAPVLVNGVECKTAGRVSMDMTTIDLRSYPQAKPGDEVILWGDGLPLERLVPYTHNSKYDILTGVQNRVKFFWHD